MSLLTSIKESYRSLRANLGRSLLTILGIVIGIIAIVLVIAIGQGAQQLILGEVESFGSNMVVVRPGRQPKGPADIANTLFGESLTNREINALRRPENVPDVTSVEPAVIVSGSISYQENVYRPVILGWTSTGMEDFFRIFPEEGNNFTDEDVKQRAKVAVLGHRVKQELFGDSEAINKTVKIRGHNIKVVGTLPKSGQVSSFNVDEIVILPYTTAQKDLMGINHYHEVIIRVKTDADPAQVAGDIRTTLRDLHNITDSNKDDFFVLTQEDMVESISTISTILTIFLVAIASISLMVGGVGIMNIMLVSVTERTQEIGLRKAVGATNQNIMRQFLLESIILTMSGGAIGTALAVTLSFIITIVVRTQYNLDWPLNLPVGAILLGVGTATAIGLIFGIYPARKAARKNPIDALRHE
ncbi:MAG: ABC transporter permease [bacterium]